MLRTMALTHELKLVIDVPLEQLTATNFKWYWVDFKQPTETEARLLDTHFHFHPLAIEDCLYKLQRPKLDHYEDTHFFVLHALHPNTLAAEEVDLFLSQSFLVTFHTCECSEVEDAWARVQELEQVPEDGPIYIVYRIMDKLVDNYFPSLYLIEDELNEIDNNEDDGDAQQLMDQLFDIRGKLLKIRKTILPMRDLVYRIMNSDRIEGMKGQLFYFTDIYDHLLKQADMIESNREMSSDIRDGYMALSSNRMNTIMKTLTVITTIFMPLTFIAGIYGMNFQHMPELAWQWGYFAILGLMFGIGFGMFLWFWRKGWFE